jgi:hypothetical protein
MRVYSISLALTYVAEDAIYFDGVDIVYTFLQILLPQASLCGYQIANSPLFLLLPRTPPVKPMKTDLPILRECESCEYS